MSEELATATFMETDQNELRCSKCILKEALDCNATSAAPKSKALTFCSHPENLDIL